MAIPLQLNDPSSTAADAILCQKYRELARHHLRSLPALFTKFTGMFSHLAWAPAWPHRWSARYLPTQSQLCRGITAGRRDLVARCRRCATRHLALALKSGHKGHLFTCFAGVHNFWLPIIVRGCVVGLAFVQARANHRCVGARTFLSASARQRSGMRTGISALHFPAARGGRTLSMSRSDFSEAAKLLHLVFEHVETSALADLRKSDLKQAQQALVSLQTVATRLRRELNGLVPAFNKTGPVLQPDTHPEQTVRAALACIHASYSQPVTLKQCAHRLGLNAAYLSALFSRGVGVPFKTYLTEVRMEKARQLLSEPARTISEVACAVGYTSENRFRIAFKNVTGLSPSLWRETLRMQG